MIKYLKYPFFLLYFLLIFYFYFLNLGYENINEDQYRWYTRTENFFNSLNQGDFSGTYQQYHPGVFLIYLIKSGTEIFKITHNTSFTSFKEIPYTLFPEYNFYTKIFIVSFILISILIATMLIKEIFGKFISLSFLIFITFDTYFIGVTRNLHMDSLVTLQIFVSLISFYAFLKNKENKYLYISMFYSGLGLLTKSVFIISFLFQFLISIYFFIQKKSNLTPIKSFFINFLGSLLIFTALFPSMWVNPTGTLSKIFIEGSLETGLKGENNFMHYVNGYELPDPGPKFYFHVLNFRLSPMIYFSFVCILLFIVIELIFKKKLKITHDPLIMFLISLVILYFSVLTYSSKKTDRYLIVIFPHLALITAYYLRVIWPKITHNVFKFIFVLFTLISIVHNFQIHPFYFAFYNPIFGGVIEAQKRIYINQGGIAYLQIIEKLKEYPTKKYSAINYEELKYSSKAEIQPLNYFNFNEGNFIRIVPLQRGNNLLKTSKFIGNINIMNQPYWRIYEQ